MVTPPTTPTPQALPYGPVLTRLLEPLRRGFLMLNRWFMVPALDAGLGPLIGSPATGHLMVLRTRGRRSGRLREVPLGYVIRDGAVYCVAGYGETTPWYLNLLADPEVDVVLPGRRIRGRAEPVGSDAEWLGAYRALIASFGIVGRLVDGDVASLDDATLLATHRTLPVIRIRPTEAPAPIEAGSWDPGGNGWLVSHGLVLAALLAARIGVRRVRRFVGRRVAA